MGKILPTEEWRFANYAEAWKKGMIGEHLLNSVIITAVNGCEMLYALFASLMLIPLGQTVMIPQYRIISSLHLVDTYPGIVLLYTASGIPFSVFLLTSFLRKLPIELDEAACIDGCSRLKIMGKIILPLSKPGIATVIIYQGMNIWNDYYTALIYLRTKKTVTLGLKNFMGNWGLVDYNRLFAAIAIVTLPIILLYIIFQKQFIGGLTAGSVKG